LCLTAWCKFPSVQYVSAGGPSREDRVEFTASPQTASSPTLSHCKLGPLLIPDFIQRRCLGMATSVTDVLVCVYFEKMAFEHALSLHLGLKNPVLRPPSTAWCTASDSDLRKYRDDHVDLEESSLHPLISPLVTTSNYASAFGSWMPRAKLPVCGRSLGDADTLRRAYQALKSTRCVATFTDWMNLTHRQRSQKES
jgi:hypothetical protein